MQIKKYLVSMFLPLSIISISTPAAEINHQPKHFRKTMIVMFENMSYAEIKNEPTFKKLVEYTGNSLDENGHLVKLLHAGPTQDTAKNNYAFYSSYYNNHSGGIEPSRPSQPNYIAMTSGSVHSIKDNDMHNLDVDNLAIELNEANLGWKVYAEDLPDPKISFANNLNNSENYTPVIKPYNRDPNKSEQENDLAEQKYISAYKNIKYPRGYASHLFAPVSGCFSGESHVDGPGNADDGYMRKHEPFISYVKIQNHRENCMKIVNASHLQQDINNMPEVTFYIPNQINDGHNGTLEERVIRANTFLSKMMGTNPKTGEPLPDAANAPFQKFMAQDGLLVITFDEPSVTGDPDKTIYTLFVGNMINSGAYPNRAGEKTPICYPPISEQTKYPHDTNGAYEPSYCNHYNLLKLIEENWNLRGLDNKQTSSGYKYAFALDHGVPSLWKSIS